MNVGTKSLLFGCHQFFIHPYYVAKGWKILYGNTPEGMRLAILIHDWGLWGMEEFDGKEDYHSYKSGLIYLKIVGKYVDFMIWRQVVFHSSSYAKEVGTDPSWLCWADKLGTALMPSLLWAILAKLSGEGIIYLTNPKYKYEISYPYTIKGLIQFHKQIKKWTKENVPLWV